MIQVRHKIEPVARVFQRFACVLDLLLPRNVEEPALALPMRVFRQVMRARLRFDPHFRRRPWLPDMQHLADPYSGDLADAVLAEPAILTVRGIFESTNRLIEDLSELLLAAWSDPQMDITLPSTEWEPEQSLEVEFAGFAPGRLERMAAAFINPEDAERIALAARLRQEELL